MGKPAAEEPEGRDTVYIRTTQILAPGRRLCYRVNEYLQNGVSFLDITYDK